MKSTVWSEELELAGAAQPSGGGEPARTGSKITTLKTLTLSLLRELQSIEDVDSLSLENGLDFYDEVSRFEIDLIKRALLQTGGHQVRAARLLHLKITTLNSKIKHYKICLEDLASFRMIEPGKSETGQHA
jgi:transcriptional regulator with GAF, ATPase, and Fis domain